jgi:tRNA(Ile)-lysidine synthase
MQARGAPPTGPLAAEEFAARMDPLGPFEPHPRLAVAVSGGADSMTLALLADAWARARGGDARAIVIDHGLRPAAAAEAALTGERLAARGIAAEVITLALAHGPGLAARARTARHAALAEAASRDGRLHLLLGHHAADQAETLLLRLLSGSGPAGRAGMAALTETEQVRLLRPLLGVPPVRLRATLAAAGVAWVEDPSNIDPTAARARLRTARRDRDGIGPATGAAVQAAHASARARAAEEAAVAAELARVAAFYPEGYALLASGLVSPAALAAVLRVVAGAEWAPAEAAVARLAGMPEAATLGGARLLPGGRLGAGWLVLREAAAIGPPVPAQPGAVWDGRFRLGAAADLPEGCMIGPVAEQAARLRRLSHLPSAVLGTLPALWCGGVLLAVPMLGWPDPSWRSRCPLRFAPPVPATGGAFVAAT